MKKIIKFRNRNPSSKAKILAAINDIKNDIENDDYSEICITWRKITKEDGVEFWLTDYIWWSKSDRLALAGMLDYVKGSIMKHFAENDQQF